jgi:hypothetical protein
LFEQQDGNSAQREFGELPGRAELPGPGRPGYGGFPGPDDGAAEPEMPDFGSIEYGQAGYYDRAPRYGWDLDSAARPDSRR